MTPAIKASDCNCDCDEARRRVGLPRPRRLGGWVVGGRGATWLEVDGRRLAGE
ncbi:MAG: hypothetical protein HY901_00215 [Deltaproteobacteria bacterium]|nr:hypothetical protein [Deltaproteobacteria bacterium]